MTNMQEAVSASFLNEPGTLVSSVVQEAKVYEVEQIGDRFLVKRTDLADPLNGRVPVGEAASLSGAYRTIADDQEAS